MRTLLQIKDNLNGKDNVDLYLKKDDNMFNVNCISSNNKWHFYKYWNIKEIFIQSFRFVRTKDLGGP